MRRPVAARSQTVSGCRIYPGRGNNSDRDFRYSRSRVQPSTRRRMSHDAVVARRPRGMAVMHVLCFPVTGAGLIPPTLVAALPSVAPWGSYVAFGLALYCVVLYARSRRVRLLLRQDGLTVVNLFRTRTIPAGAIAGFEWGRFGMVAMGGDRCVDVVTEDGGRVHIQATVGLRVRRGATGEIESRFDDGAIRQWAARRNFRYWSETAAWEERVGRSRPRHLATLHIPPSSRHESGIRKGPAQR